MYFTMMGTGTIKAIGTGTFEVYGGIDLGLNIDTVPGPDLSVEGYVEADLTAGSNPWWTLNAGVRGAVEYNVKFDSPSFDLGMDVSLPLFDGPKKKLWDSGGPLPGRVSLSPTGTPARATRQLLHCNRVLLLFHAQARERRRPPPAPPGMFSLPGLTRGWPA